MGNFSGKVLWGRRGEDRGKNEERKNGLLEVNEK